MNNQPINLIDNAGTVVYQWNQKGGHHAVLLDNGNLLTGGSLRSVNGRDQRGLKEIAPNGRTVWECQKDHYHHDSFKLPNGNILMLVREYKTSEEAIAAGANPAFIPDDGWILEGRRYNGLMVDTIIEVQPGENNGCQEVWKWTMWDHLIQDFDPALPNYGVVAEHPELIDLNYLLPHMLEVTRNPEQRRDWTHANAIDWHPELDQIVITARNYGEIWIIDHSTTPAEAASHTGGNSGRGGDLLYRWGNPQAYDAGTEKDTRLFGAHNAHWIDEGLPGAGNILIFNNGFATPIVPPGGQREYSSIVEITPPVDGYRYRHGYGYRRYPGSAYAPVKPVWTYVADPPDDFYGRFISGVQRLPNGNTLINEGPNSIFFEVTPEGKTVWKYDAFPAQDEEHNRVYRVSRYAPDHPGLQYLGLAP